MTSLEATDLAVRIRQTFSGPPTDVWEQDLAELDAGRAGTAYARLRREHNQRWLAIADFMTAYRAVHSAPPAHKTPDCADCDNTGCVPSPPYTAGGRDYHGVKPCPRCEHGKRMATNAAFQHQPHREFIPAGKFLK